jgi:hypothetical protein
MKDYVTASNIKGKRLDKGPLANLWKKRKKIDHGPTILTIQQYVVL